MTKPKEGAADWEPQKSRADGVYLAGASELPANHRLRAEALAARGVKKDPDGIISEALIADTAERLKAEAKAAAADQAPATKGSDD